MKEISPQKRLNAECSRIVKILSQITSIYEYKPVQVDDDFGNEVEFFAANIRVAKVIGA